MKARDEWGENARQSDRNWQNVITLMAKLEERIPYSYNETLKRVSQVAESSLMVRRGRPAGHTEFKGSVEGGKEVVCVPLTTMYRDETPRLILNYSRLCAALHIQQFFGIFQDSTGQYAVMEDLQDQKDIIPLSDTIQDRRFQQENIDATQRKLQLCYEIANTVAYFHSINLVVKVISDRSIHIRFTMTDMFPIFSNLETACLVKQLTINS